MLCLPHVPLSSAANNEIPAYTPISYQVPIVAGASVDAKLGKRPGIFRPVLPRGFRH